MSNDTPTGRPEGDTPEVEGSVPIDAAQAEAEPFVPVPAASEPIDAPLIDPAPAESAPPPLIEPEPLVVTTPVDPAVDEPVIVTTEAELAAAEVTAEALAVEPVADPVAAEFLTTETAAAEASAAAASTAYQAAAGELGADAAAAVAAPLPPTPQVVYVTQPEPPKPKGNRGAGIAFAVLATIVFGGVLAGVAALLSLATGTPRLPAYFSTAEFWAPVIVFGVASIVVALIVNRAGWWAHVLGGFIVALLSYGGFLLGAWIAAGAWSTPSANTLAFFDELWLQPLAIAAFVIGREVPIWLGALTGRRGRKVAQRNAEARASYDREQEAVRADLERRRQGLI